MSRTKKYELIVEYYGLDAATLAVDSLAVASEGLVYRWTTKGYIERKIALCTPDEIGIAFGLIELVEVAPRTPSAGRKQVIMDLEGRRAALATLHFEQERPQCTTAKDDSAAPA